jgi:hypothetical protein
VQPPRYHADLPASNPPGNDASDPLSLADRLFPPTPHFGREERQYVCPVCGFEYVHFGEGLRMTDGEYNPANLLRGRGPELQIPMWCENGHEWVLAFGFHKGQMFTNEAIFVGQDWWGEAMSGEEVA